MEPLTFDEAKRADELRRKATPTPEERAELAALDARARANAPKDDPSTPDYDESATPIVNEQRAEFRRIEAFEAFKRGVTIGARIAAFLIRLFAGARR